MMSTYFTILLMAFSLSITVVHANDESYPSATADTVEQLKQGGYILYFRHAETDQQQIDQQPVDYNDCATQRNLSAAGQQQALDIGQAIKALGIEIEHVFTSPYCRTQDTAKLAFDRAEVKPFLAFSINMSASQRAEAALMMKKLLNTPPTSGKNTVIVGHTGNLRESTGHWPKPEGVAFVFRPNGNNTVTLIARISPDEWTQLLNEAR
jgi:phosphohistidine phosphatase SixA